MWKCEMTLSCRSSYRSWQQSLAKGNCVMGTRPLQPRLRNWLSSPEPRQRKQCEGGRPCPVCRGRNRLRGNLSLCLPAGAQTGIDSSSQQKGERPSAGCRGRKSPALDMAAARPRGFERGSLAASVGPRQHDPRSRQGAPRNPPAAALRPLPAGAPSYGGCGSSLTQAF